jgi:glutathione S-transferase
MAANGVTLYHGTTSVCAIKVRLALEEKGVAYDGPILDLRKGDQFDPGYLNINPGAVVPTLVHDGQIIPESSVIMAYVDDAFPGPALSPPSAIEKARMRLWMKEIDDPVHPACGTLTHAIVFRKVFLTKAKEEQEATYARIPDAGRRERQRQVNERGLDAPIAAGAVKTYSRLLGRMEKALSDGPWLTGRHYTLADAAATPYVNRLEMMGALGPWAPAHPRVVEWFGRIKARPSFAAAVTKFFTPGDARQFATADPNTAETLKRLLAA